MTIHPPIRLSVCTSVYPAFVLFGHAKIGKIELEEAKGVSRWHYMTIKLFCVYKLLKLETKYLKRLTAAAGMGT